MTLDPQIRELLDLFASDASIKPIGALTPSEMREQTRRMSRAFGGRPPEVGDVLDRQCPGPDGDIGLRVYTPRAAQPPGPAVVFFHGGGWVTGDLESHDTLCRTLCSFGAVRVIAVDYRLAPEHPFPAAVLDALAATRWVASNAASLGIDRTRMGVAGDSAGGNLAAVVAQELRGIEPALRAQLLIYPVVDTRIDTPSYIENATGYLLERAGMQWFFERYAPDPRDVRAAPLNAADLSNLPPALILTAGYDPLRDEARAYASALRDAGNSVELREKTGLVHGFATMGGVCEAGRKAVEEAGRWLRVIFAAHQNFM